MSRTFFFFFVHFPSSLFIFIFLIAHSFSFRISSFLLLWSLSFFYSHFKINLIDSLPDSFSHYCHDHLALDLIGLCLRSWTISLAITPFSIYFILIFLLRLHLSYTF